MGVSSQIGFKMPRPLKTPAQKGMPVPVDYEIHVRRIRQRRNQKLVVVANAAHVSAGALSQLERNIGPSPRIETIDRLSQWWDIPFWQIVTFRRWPCPCCCHFKGELEVPHAEPRRDR